jgi:hypothetical protein
MYLPEKATIDEACEWLKLQTGDEWTLARLLEEGRLVPGFWKDYEEGMPHIFGHRREGYLCKMIAHGDVVRLAADGVDAKFTMFTTHDETAKDGENGVHVFPPFVVQLHDLRFVRKDLEAAAARINGSKPETAPTLPPKEDPVDRQNRCLQACIDAGLRMDKTALLRLPDGVGKVADKEGKSRQAFSADVKAALRRRVSASRERVTVHRA